MEKSSSKQNHSYARCDEDFFLPLFIVYIYDSELIGGCIEWKMPTLTRIWNGAQSEREHVKYNHFTFSFRFSTAVSNSVLRPRYAVNV